MTIDLAQMIISSSNHWLFVGSRGDLSARRKDLENAIFSYYSQRTSKSNSSPH
jgi:hypothetical protein